MKTVTSFSIGSKLNSIDWIRVLLLSYETDAYFTKLR